jgi:hypothetical protein
MRDTDVQREINRAIDNKTTTGWRKRQIARNEDDDIQEYARPWRGLTDEEIGESAVKSQVGISPRDDTLRFARMIETKLKEKNHG